MSAGSFLGATAGTFIGGYLTNEVANNIFGKDPTNDENVEDALIGTVESGIVNLINQLLQWLR